MAGSWKRLTPLLKRHRIKQQRNGLPTSRVCEAVFSLAEGKITTTTYFPSRAGSTLQISYRNSAGQPVRHSFGEKAIVEVLSRIRRWRHLIETLEHMSKSASRVNALNSLNRLNSFLVDKQQDDFNRYLDGLALHGAPTTPPMQYAWDVQDSMIYGQKKAILLAPASRQTNTRQA